MTKTTLLGTAALALLLAGTSANAQIAIGHLQDQSGGTSDVGTPYGQGVVDAFAWINKNGGVAGFTSWMGFTSWQGTGSPSSHGVFVLSNSHGGTPMGINAMKLLLRG